MPPKKTTKAGPAPVPSDFLGAVPKRQPTAAAAAKAAGAPKPGPLPKTKTKQEVRGDKRQRNSSGASANTPKKQRETHDPRAQATALGGRHRVPPSPTTSISTIASEATDTGTVEDQEVGDELAGIKKCISDMQVGSVPAPKVCILAAFLGSYTI